MHKCIDDNPIGQVNRWSNVAQVTQNVINGYGMNLWQHIALHLGLHSPTITRVLMSAHSEHARFKSGFWSSEKMLNGTVLWAFLYNTYHVHVNNLSGEVMAQEYTKGTTTSRWKKSWGQCWGPSINVHIHLTQASYSIKSSFQTGYTLNGSWWQDNAPCHSKNTVQKWFKKHEEFKVLPWPPNSPDLNPTEYIWDMLD